MPDIADARDLSSLDASGPGDGPPTAVVIEDDPRIRPILMRAVGKALPACRVHGCANGREALDALATLTPRLLVTDLMMEGADGWDVLRYVAERPRLAGTVRVVITALPEEHPRLGELAPLGVGLVVHKPFGMASLVANLEAVMRDDAEDAPRVCGTAADGSGPTKVECASAVFEPAWIIDACGDDLELIEENVALFRGDLAGQIDALAAAAEAEDVEAIRFQAHRLVGAAGQLGGRRLREVARNIENTSPETRVATCRERLPCLRREHERLLDALARVDWPAELHRYGS